MDAIWTFISMLGCSAVWLLPTALTAAALVDMVRVRAEWYWCFIIFGIPFFGPLAYFAVSYLPIFGNSRALSNLSPSTYRRTQARRRLRQIQIQLQHWRGPALLAEAGAQYLALGKWKQAEELLREAKEAGAEVKDVNFNFAQVLQVKGQRWREALPLLEELVDLEPDARFGSARLALARCLDEVGDTRAEEELRAVLDKRSPPEARVRLARLLLARGDGQEATELLAEAQADGRTLPKYLYKEHKAWIRVASKLRGPATKLPAPKLEGVPPRLSSVQLAAVAVGGVVILATLVGLFRMAAPILGSFGSMGDYQELWQAKQAISDRLDATDRLHPASVDSGDAASVVAALPTFLAVRRGLKGACQAARTAHDSYQDWHRKLLAGDGAGSPFGALNGEMAWQQAQVDLGRAFAEALETAEIGRAEFRNLATLADGSFLARREARVLTLPEHFRSDYMQALALADQPLPPRSEPQWRRTMEADIAQAEAKLQGFESLSEAGLTDELRTALEPLRVELESSMAGECLEWLLPYLDPALADDYGYEDY